MRHYGAPSRLLDCTYSIHVAAYFAYEFDSEECAIWAINGDWIAKTEKALYASQGKDAQFLVEDLGQDV